MQLFAYPSDRRMPWATLGLLAVSGCLTATAAWHWRCRVCSSQSLEELQPRLRSFSWGLSSCSLSIDDLKRGEVHRLLLVSLLRAGEQSARVFADAVVLVGCGTLLERLYGPGFVVSLVVGGTVTSNAAAAMAHASLVPPGTAPEAPRLASTAGGVAALGAFCALRHGRWAAVPGAPVPVAWLMAPLLAAVFSSYSTFRQQMAERKAAATAAATAASEEKGPDGLDAPPAPAVEMQADDDAVMSAFEAMVAMAGCEAAEERARSECRPPPADIVAWREEVEQVVEAAPPMAPDGAFLADIAGALFGAAFCLVARRVV